MKRTPMKRTAMRRGARKTRYASRPRNVAFMMFVKSLPCAAARLHDPGGVSPCAGPIEADHAGRRGLGQKCGDEETIPLCSGHHRDRHDWSGPFALMTRDEMRAFLAATIAETQTLAALAGLREAVA